VSDSQECPKCGFAFSGAGFGMATCTQCGEIFLLQEASNDSAPNLDQQPSPPLTFQLDEVVSEEKESPVSLKDLADFGNEEQPSTSTGGLIIDLSIKGVDSVEQRKFLAEVLGDRRLSIDVNLAIDNMKNGHLILERLNPVKASVIVSKIKHLSFDVSWVSRQLVQE
jgi:hypothetical protein